MTGPITSSGYNLNVNWRALVLPQQVDDPVTDAQLDAAARWAAAQIRAGLARRDARWHGHRCVTAKACPGQHAFDRIEELQAITDHYVTNGLDTMLTDQDIERLAAANTRHLLTATVDDERDTNVRTALRRASRTLDELAQLDDQVADRVVELVDQQPASTPTADAIKAAVKQALREGVGE